MFVLSVGGIRKKLAAAIALLLVAAGVILAVHLFPMGKAVNSSVDEHHYPGEPVRVSGDIDEYWQERLSVLEE